MTQAEFAYLRAFLRERSGLSLPVDKLYLARSRLAAVRRRFGLASDADLVRRLRLRPDPDLAAAVVESMSTNETFFFRDRTAFELLRTVLLPRAVANRRGAGRIRIWSAAASSGQEAYSIAMLAREMGRDLRGCAVDILGTDISAAMIDRARAGRYSQREVQRGLPVRLLLAHFAKEGSDWVVAEEIRSSVRFEPLNLARGFDHLGPFDIVLCRNVLIYFDASTKRQVVEGLARVLRPDGAAFFGGADAPLGSTEALVPDGAHATVFVKAPRRPSPPRPARDRPSTTPGVAVEEVSAPESLPVSPRESLSAARPAHPAPGSEPSAPRPARGR